MKKIFALLLAGSLLICTGNAAAPQGITVRTPAGDFFLEADETDAEGFLQSVCEKNAREGTDARLIFTADGFTYISEENAISCNYRKLKGDAERARREGATEIRLECCELVPRRNVGALKKETQPIASFSTRFDEGNVSRAANVALAARRISGTTVLPREEFSFNAAVGARTAANGFSEAPVIENGQFTLGVGGGVCQTSTTLFNAALLAGMEITESHPHSLSVSYVPPSLDAMVSSYSDLKFKNPFDTPVYILAETEAGSVSFFFYGLPCGRRFATESAVLLRVAPPEEKIVEGERERVLRAAREGIASESYLLEYENGTLLRRTRIRRDVYAAVQGIVERPPSEQKEGTESPEEEKNCEMTGKIG